MEKTQKNFKRLNENELMNTSGGFDIAAPIKAIYNIGQDVGAGLAKWF